MSSKRVRLISFIGIILIAIVIGASMLVNLLSKDSLQVDLPEPNTSVSTTDGSGGSINNRLDRVEITKENVQAVIAVTATLKRPDSYTRIIEIKDDFAIYAIIATAYHENTALKVTSALSKKNIIITGDMLYIWYDGDNTLYERPIESFEDEKRSSDEYQMIMSYEDVLNIDKSSITDAGYKSYNGEDCIYVQYVTDLLNYHTECYISVATGLLVGALQYEGNTLIYTMTSSGYNSAVPDLSAFNLPDGKNPVSVP